MRNLYFILLFTVTIGFAQNKKTYFFDEKWRPLTEKEFKATEANKDMFSHFFESDTATVGKVYLFENYGKLEPKLFN